MDRSELIERIEQIVRDYRSELDGVSLSEINEYTRLFGREGVLDSLGLVNVVLEVEQMIGDKSGSPISLMDDRAMSQSRSPFRTVGSLADYILQLLNGTRDGA